MELTPEQLRQNAAAMIAHADEKPIEAFNGTLGEWVPCCCPAWNCNERLYRPKPEPKTRPWSKPDDVPGPVCWVRCDPSDKEPIMIIGLWLRGVSVPHTNGVQMRQWEEIEAEGWQYSTDRKTWHKCEVAE